jgi:hypothetical protein
MARESRLEFGRPTLADQAEVADAGGDCASAALPISDFHVAPLSSKLTRTRTIQGKFHFIDWAAKILIQGSWPFALSRSVPPVHRPNFRRGAEVVRPSGVSGPMAAGEILSVLSDIKPDLDGFVGQAKQNSR